MATQAFKVQRGTFIFGATATAHTLTAGVDYTAPASILYAFMRIVDVRFSGTGRTSGGSQQDDREWGVWITNPANLLTSQTFNRYAQIGNDCRVTWELIEYIGAPGGPNEFFVRALGAINTTANPKTGSTITTISDVAQTVLFITGQAGSAANRAQGHRWQNTAALVANGPNWDPVFTTGANALQTAVSYAAVEFTGSNWLPVQRIEWSGTATAWGVGNNNGSTQAIPTALGAVSRAFLHFQYRVSPSSQVQDEHDTALIQTTTTLFFQNAVTDGTRVKVAWIVENSETDANLAMVREGGTWQSDQVTGFAEEHIIGIVMSAVRALEECSIMGECSTQLGTGTIAPTCAHGFVLGGTAAVPNVSIYEAEGNLERRVYFELVQWPRDPEAEVCAFPSAVTAQDGGTHEDELGNTSDAELLNSVDSETVSTWNVPV